MMEWVYVRVRTLDRYKVFPHKTPLNAFVLRPANALTYHQLNKRIHLSLDPD